MVNDGLVILTHDVDTQHRIVVSHLFACLPAAVMLSGKTNLSVCQDTKS